MAENETASYRLIRRRNRGDNGRLRDTLREIMDDFVNFLSIVSITCYSIGYYLLEDIFINMKRFRLMFEIFEIRYVNFFSTFLIK